MVFLNAKKSLVDRCKQSRIVISRSADHHRIHLLKMSLKIIQLLDAAVDLNLQLRKLSLQPIDILVPQRWHIPILLGAQPLQPSLPGVHAKAIAVGLRNDRHEIMHVLVSIQIINTNPVLNRYLNINLRLHRLHALRNTFRPSHQRGTELSIFDTVARAAHVDVYFRVAPLLRQPRTLGECFWIVAAKLQRQR